MEFGRRLYARGFSLVELMVVIAVVAILSAVAVPVFRDYLVRSRVTSTFHTIDIVSQKQKELFNRTGQFGAPAQLGFPVGSAYYYHGSPTTFSPYIQDVVINGRASGAATFSCSDGSQFSELTITLNNSAIGYTGSIGYMILLREVNGVILSKCFYRSDITSAAIAAKYLPASCQAAAGNPSGTECNLPW